MNASAHRPPPAPWRAAAVVIVTMVVAAAGAGCGRRAPDQPPVPTTVSPELRESLLRARPLDPAEQAADQREYYRSRNDAMVACMSAAGFDYRTFVPPPPTRVRLGLSEEEFVRKYGMGVSTLIDDYRPPTVDPNDAVRDALPENARRTYDRRKMDCDVQAVLRLGIPPDGGRFALPEDLAEPMGDAAIESGRDPRVTAARAAYEACMASKGFALQPGEQIGGALNEQAAPLGMRFLAGRERLVKQGRDPASVRLADVLTTAELAQLARIQERELAITGADWDCGRDYRRLSSEVQREYVERFLDTRR